MRDFTDLEVWKKALLLMEEVYSISRKFPREEKFELTSQVRRASSSILANIAEGFGRFTFADKANRYTIARGECTEVQAFLLIAERLQYASSKEIQEAIHLAKETGRMLSGLISVNRKRVNEPSP